MDPDNNYREEAPVSMASRSADDESDSNPPGRSPSESAFLKTRGRCLKIGTWNVRTLYQPGKLENVIQEMQNMNLDILGIAETHWTEEGKIKQEKHTMIYSGGENHRNGVGIVMKNSVSKSMIGFWTISERVIMIKLKAKPFNINIIQVYAPTQDHDDEEIEKFYQEIQNGIKYVKSDEIMCIMGDLNAKVGDEKYQNIIGMHGLGQRNERGERLIQFCQENKLFVANTWFQHPVRKLYTWKSPGDISRNQIDYIMFNDRFRNCVKQAKTYPGADINSDHNPVVVKIIVKLKKTNETKRSEQLDLNLLREEIYKNRYNVEVQNTYERLCIEETEQQPDNECFDDQCDKKWNTVKQSIKASLNAVLPRKANKKRQKWMTDHILKLMEKRKHFKNRGTDEYNKLNKQINSECKEAKEQWLINQCEEVEQLEKQYKLREMHSKVKELASKNLKKKTSSCIKDKDGNILFDQEKIADRWVEYITELYGDDREQMPKFQVTSGESIMKDEIQKAIKSMKDGKAVGADELPAEALKALDDQNIEIIVSLCNMIYNRGMIPTEMKHSVFITLPKKPKAMNCTEFRTISLMSHVTKLLLKIIQQRIANKIDKEVNRLQCGFRPGTGTREGIFNLRTICERANDVQKDVYICFIDYTKAFDRVKHLKLIECLSEIGIDDKDLQIITKMYWEQSAAVRTEDGMTSEFKIKKGVRQGCVLSPNLFNLYTEKIFREVEDMKGVSIGGVNINNLRYADDTVLIAENSMDLQALLTAVSEKGKSYGMEMNITKTRSMVVSRNKPVPNISIKIEGKPIQQVDSIIYLGFMTTEDGKCDKEIKRRIEIARTAFENMSKILTSRTISINVRLRIAKCYIWSTLLYGAEIWTLTKVTSNKLEAFEMWLYRRMLRISWTEHKTNEEVLNQMKTKRTLLNTIKTRKLQYFGHIIRKDHIQRLLMEGRMNGKRGRGRPRTMWTDNIKKWTNLSYSDCIRAAQDRVRRRSMTADLSNTDGTR